jgi:hypothetical protein
MNPKEELRRCARSPYYFATRYMKIKNKDGVWMDFITLLSEAEFNKQFSEFLNKTKKG